MNSTQNSEKINPDDFWKPWEDEVSSYDGFNEILHDIFEKWITDNRQFVWRGVVDATWSLHSSLYRHLINIKDPEGVHGYMPTENEILAEEGEILAEVHRWGLHNGPRGRLSIFEQFAMLQHFGAPTRFVDITFSPYVGLWFAVEKCDDIDGRLFAIDITDKLINENDRLRRWEDVYYRPWKANKNENVNKKEDGCVINRNEWCTNVYVWRPASFESRIAAQQSGFLFGGVPQSSGGRKPKLWPKSTAGDGNWKIKEVRQFTSLALRTHKLSPRGGGKIKNPAYTIRIRAKAKREIRQRLESLLGYRHSTLFPDFPGFASHGIRRFERMDNIKK